MNPLGLSVGNPSRQTFQFRLHPSPSMVLSTDTQLWEVASHRVIPAAVEAHVKDRLAWHPIPDPLVTVDVLATFWADAIGYAGV